MNFMHAKIVGNFLKRYFTQIDPIMESFNKFAIDE